MKKILLSAVILFFSFASIAQYVPQGFNYQAVARDRNGKVITNSKLVVEITIREGSLLGPVVWQEGHTVITNDFGLFDLIIGEGVTTGLGTAPGFSNIAWGRNSHYLEVRVDFGNGLIYMGNSKFMSVPYALVADSVKNSGVPKYMVFDSINSIKVETKGFKLPTGASSGAVLMSDANGNATWNQSGGDVTGPYNNLTVIRIQGRPVSAAAPSDGQILKWNSTLGSWVLAADNTNPSLTSGSGISINGTIINADSNKAIWNANQLQGKSISTTTPNIGQVLKWDGTSWIPDDDLGGTYLAGDGIDITGNTISALINTAGGLTFNSGAIEINAGSTMNTSGGVLNANNSQAIWNASQLSGSPIDGALSPSDGQILTWNAVTSQWEAKAPATSVTTNSNYVTINGTTINADSTKPIWNANQLYNTPISNSLSPSDGYILTWNGTSNQWEAKASATSVTTNSNYITINGTTINADSTKPIWNANQLYNTAVSNSLSPSDGHILTWNGTSNQWEAKIPATVTTTTNNYVTINGTVINADSTKPIWNANKLQSFDIATTTPGNNQVLQYDAVAGMWKPVTFTIVGATTFVSGSGISIGQSGSTITITNTGDTNSANDITTSTSAGGDLSGTYPNPSVVGLQGFPVSSTAPSSNQILTWNGITNTWEPKSPSVTATTSSSYVTINGVTINADSTKPIWNANKLYGTPVSASLSPANGNVLTWDGTSSQWEAKAPASTTYTPGIGIDISGTTIMAKNTDTIWNANKLYGKNLPTSAPSANQLLKFDGTNWTYVNESSYQYSAGTGITISSNTINVNHGTTLKINAGKLDADSNSPKWNAFKLYNTPISSGMTPANGNVLTWNGTSNQWEASAPTGATYSAGTGISISGTTINAKNTDTIWNANRLYGKDLPTTAPSANQLLKYDGTNWTYVNESAYQYAAGSGISIASNTISVNYGTTMKLNAGKLDADSSSPKWNAFKLYNTPVSSSMTPANGNVLTWNGTSNQWEAAAPASTTYTASTGISITGTTISAKNTDTIWNANKLYGKDLPSAAPVANQLLKFDGTNWTYVNESNYQYTAGDGINIAGNVISAKILTSTGLGIAFGSIGINYGATLTVVGGTINAKNTDTLWNANQLFNTRISNSLLPTNGQVLTWNGVSKQWESKDPAGGYTAGNGIDITGTTISAKLLTTSGLAFNGSNIAINHGTTLKVTGGKIDADSSRAIWNANKLYGKDLPSAAPVANQLLKFDGTNWTYVNESNYQYTAGDGINIAGNVISAKILTNTGLGISFGSIGINYGATLTVVGGTINAKNTDTLWNANKLFNTRISNSLAPTNGQVLTWNGASGQWESKDPAGGYTAGNGIDITGTTISAKLLTTSGLAFNGSNIAINHGTTLKVTGGKIDADSSRAIWNANKLNGKDLPSAAPVANQLLKFDGTNWTYVNESNYQYTAGDGINIAGNVISTKILTSTGLGYSFGSIGINYGSTLTVVGGTINAKNTDTLWNANQLFNTRISNSLLPTNGQVLTWNGVSKQWESKDPAGGYTAGNGIDITGTTISAKLLTTSGLAFNGSSIAINHGTTLKVTGGKIDADSSRAIWNANKLNGKDLPSAAPVANQLLKFDGTNWTYVNESNYQYTAGDGINIAGNVISTKILTSTGLGYNFGSIGINYGATLTVVGGTINAKNTDTLWNANQLFNTRISNSLAPTNGQVLTWNGTSKQWESKDPSGGYTAGNGIDITGTTISAKILTTSGLAFSGTNIAINHGTTLKVTGGKIDADSSRAIWNANKLSGTAISATLAPADKHILTWNGTTSQWETKAMSSVIKAGKGISISNDTVNVSLSSNSGLMFNGSNQLEIKPGAGLYLTSGAVAAYYDSAIWNAGKIMNRSISTTAPNDKQILTYNGTTLKWEASGITQVSDADGNTKIHLEKTANEDRIRFDAGGKEKMVIDTIGIGIGVSKPTSTFQVKGSIAFEVDTISVYRINPVTLNDTFYMIASDNPTVLTNHVFLLPAASTCPGRAYLFKNVNTGYIRIFPSGTDKIDGAVGAYDFVGQWKFRKIISDGKNWLIIGAN